MFINSRFNFDVDLNGEDKTTGRQTRQEQDVTLRVLGIEQLEMFQLFQRHRHSLIDWFVCSCTPRIKRGIMHKKLYFFDRLMSHPAEANEVMESVQRVTTGAGLRARSATDLSPRGWCSMTRKDNVGRFVPDNECTKEQSQVCCISKGSTHLTCPVPTAIVIPQLFLLFLPQYLSLSANNSTARGSKMSYENYLRKATTQLVGAIFADFSMHQNYLKDYLY